MKPTESGHDNNHHRGDKVITTEQCRSRTLVPTENPRRGPVAPRFRTCLAELLCIKGTGAFSAPSLLASLATIAATLLASAGLTAALPAAAGAYATVAPENIYSSAPGLPDGRVYEQVSPGNKYGNQAGAGTQRNHDLPGAEHYGIAAPDGDAVMFEGTGPFGETASAIAALFVASKNESAAGWSTRSVTPATQQSAVEIGGEANAHPVYAELSADLSHAVVVPGTYTLAPPQAGCGGAMFLTGPNPFIPATPLCGSGVPVGGTPDFSTAYFTAPGVLLPEDAVRKGGFGFYEYSGGALREAGVLPNGSLNPYGAVPAASGHGRALTGNQIAAEGRRAFFVSPDPASCTQNGGEDNCAVEPPELYMRENGTRTLLVSRDALLPEAGGLPAPAPGGVSQMLNQTANEGSLLAGSYVFASPDGSQAFFQSGDQLTGDAPATAKGEQVVVSLLSTSNGAPRVTGGTFTLTVTVGGVVQTTAPIAYDATAAGIQSALEALSNVGVGNVTVGGGPGIPFTVTFGFALENVTTTMDSSSLVTQYASVSVQDQPRPRTYDFDVETGALTYLPNVGGQIVATDTTGSSLTFIDSTVSLATLDLWSAGANGGTVTPITQLPGQPVLRRALGEEQIQAPRVPQVRMSSDGSVVVFLTSSSLSGAFNNGGFQQLYRYDVAANTLGCVSCPPHGVTPTGNAVISQLQVNEERDGGATSYLGVDARVISADGSRAFFDTPDPLVPQDTNSGSPPQQAEGESEKQGWDVYEWENGVVYLISGGKSARNSFFLDNSANGDDVFFATNEGLVPSDTDGGYDVYDARVPQPGDNPPPTAVPCEGAVCEGAPHVPSPLTPPASTTFSGLGNIAPEPPTPTEAKKTVTKKKVRCVKGKKLSRGKCVKAAGKKKATAKKASDEWRVS